MTGGGVWRKGWPRSSNGGRANSWMGEVVGASGFPLPETEGGGGAHRSNADGVRSKVWVRSAEVGPSPGA